MARQTLASALALGHLLIPLLTPAVAAIEVTSGSPCASFCTDTNSTETTGDDIVCLDDKFNSDSTGQKFQRCMACLEDSDYKNGDENDQDWFLYNLRYAFDYCIFGYPNASDVGSNPCMTSEACGSLENALKLGITTPNNRTQYDYCDADDNVMLTDAYSDCYNCVRSDGTHNYMSNFLVALEAGCQQRPAAGTPVSLNDTVFTAAAVQPANPTDYLSGNSKVLTNTAIAGIVVGCLIIIMFFSGCFFMQYRKRKNRAARLQRARTPPFALYGASPNHEMQAYDASKLDGYVDVASPMEEKPHMDSAVGLGFDPDSKASSSYSSRVAPQLASLTTSSLPPPPAIHSPPGQLSSPEDFTTPTSATSTRSTAPLLRSPLLSPGFSIASPRNNASPKLTRDNQDAWENQRLAGSDSRNLTKKKGIWGAVAPVGFQNIQTTFDPPPKKGK